MAFPRNKSILIGFLLRLSQVDLGFLRFVNAIGTQGAISQETQRIYYVKSYKVDVSSNGEDWITLKEGSKQKVEGIILLFDVINVSLVRRGPTTSKKMRLTYVTFKFIDSIFPHFHLTFPSNNSLILCEEEKNLLCSSFYKSTEKKSSNIIYVLSTDGKKTESDFCAFAQLKPNGLHVAVATVGQWYAYINLIQRKRVWLLGITGVEPASLV